MPLKEADKPLVAAINKRKGEIDMGNTGSIISFGAAAQSELQEITQAMLAGVRNKDVGSAGYSLREIATLEENLAFADAGKRNRAAAGIELKQMEAKLRDTLKAASARGDRVGDTVGSAVPEGDL